MPIGGGGLISGIATAVKGLRPDARVIGVEPETSAALHLALEAGERVEIKPVSIADGLNAPHRRPQRDRDRRERVDEIVLVTEAEIEEAFRFLYSRAKLAVEPAGAASTAALWPERSPMSRASTWLWLSRGATWPPKPPLLSWLRR